jgi:RND family efflux transporter MFP subunit
MNKKIAIFVIFLVCVGLGFAVPFFVLTKDVAVATPHQGQAIEAVYATGTVEPTIMVPIAPRTAAHLIELRAIEGQTVQRGDVLAKLEDTEQQAAIADLNARLVFSKSDLSRKEQLFKTRSISRDILEQAKADADSLIAQIEKAKAQASYLTLIAPADGLIIKKDGEIGELIAAAQPVFYMSCCAPMRVTAEVDEEDIPQVSVGQEVLIQSDAFPDKVYHGKISAITPKGDSVARSYRVRITFDDANNPLMIGMTVETNIIIQKIDNALLIPATALANKNKVQLVRDGALQTVTVTTGIQNVDNVQITNGLASSDTIVVPFDKNLKDGQKVRVKPYIESVK